MFISVPLFFFFILNKKIEMSFSSYRTATEETSIITYFSLCSGAFGYVIASSGKVSSYSNLFWMRWELQKRFKRSSKWLNYNL